MLNFLDKFLDSITMYRLVLYALIAYIVAAVIFSFLGFLSYSPLGIVYSSLILIAVCWVSNKGVGYLFHIPTNVESPYITALILALIISPAKNVNDIFFLCFAGCIATFSKYLLVVHKKHIFNPAALAVVVTGFLLHRYASWWIGTASMLPVVMVGGLLVVRKVQKFTDVGFFLFLTTMMTLIFAFFSKTSLANSFTALFLESGVVFFATIMLTEPLTMPPTKKLQLLYVGFVALLIDPHIHVGFLSSTPELVLVVGNLLSFIMSPKYKLMVHLKEKITQGKDQVDFIFDKPQHFLFTPGQYMEWTLSHPSTDSRGNRRYFTIASSPTEDTIHLGIKFYENGSSYKRALHHLNHTTVLVGGSLNGEFTLPKDKNKKLVFLAGGIGITPFRSIIKYLIDTKEQRDIVLLYSNKIASEIMYKDIFEEGEKVGVKTIYTLTGETPKNWKGEKGRISADMITSQVLDYKNRLFYLSGPHSMVTAFEETLRQMEVPRFHIKKDFFPGFV